MKNIPLKGLSKEDRMAELWRREKKACARKLRNANKKKLVATEQAVMAAAWSVIENWCSKTLQFAIRDLEAALNAYDKERK